MWHFETQEKYTIPSLPIPIGWPDFGVTGYGSQYTGWVRTEGDSYWTIVDVYGPIGVIYLSTEVQLEQLGDDETDNWNITCSIIAGNILDILVSKLVGVVVYPWINHRVHLNEHPYRRILVSEVTEDSDFRNATYDRELPTFDAIFKVLPFNRRYQFIKLFGRADGDIHPPWLSVTNLSKFVPIAQPRLI